MATQKETAEYLDINPRHVRRLLADGVLPASKGKGGINLDACRIAYIRYLRGISSGQVKPKDDEEDDQSFFILNEKERYRKLKRENDIAEELVAPVVLLTNALSIGATQIHPLLDGIPPTLKRNNPSLTAPDLQIVSEIIAKAKNAISSLELDLNG